jgi:hypothetical protein
MAVSSRQDNTTEPLILTENSLVKNETIATNAGRTTPLLYGTVMAKLSANGQWTPFISVAGVDGSAIPRGIYLGDDIAAADIAAGIVEDCPILMGNATVNESLVVFDDGTLAAGSVIGAATIHAAMARDVIAAVSNIYFELTVNISEHEN